METKTWKGVIFASETAWRLKVGNKKWVKIENPVKQNERHTKLFKRWLNDNFPDNGFLKEIIYPVVALKNTAWFKAKETIEMPIVLGGIELVSYIKSIKGNAINDALSKAICEKIEVAKPYKENKRIEFKEGTTKYGKRYVRVRGSLKDAQEIRKNYKTKGYKVTEVKNDKMDKGVLYFYIEQ